MTTGSTPEPDRLARLAQQAADLAHEYAGLAEESGVQIVSLTRRAQLNRRMIWVVAVSVTLDIVLSVVLGVDLVQVSRNDRSIGALTHRLDTSQTTTRKNSLCPLYTLLIASETPAARAAAPDKAAYDHAAAVIRGGYAALDCAQFVSVAPTVGPSTG